MHVRRSQPDDLRGRSGWRGQSSWPRLRRSPALLALKALLKGEVPQAVVIRGDQYLPANDTTGSTWRTDVDKAGAGALLEHSIHDVDILEWLLGPIAEVTASQRTATSCQALRTVSQLRTASLTGASGRC